MASVDSTGMPAASSLPLAIPLSGLPPSPDPTVAGYLPFRSRDRLGRQPARRTQHRFTRQPPTVHRVLARSILAGHVGWVVQEVSSRYPAWVAVE
jgi:hypothetical protein